MVKDTKTIIKKETKNKIKSNKITLSCISLLYQGIVFEAAYTFLKGRLKNLFFLVELGPPEVGSR